jgi:hypothetical protein
VGFERVDLYGDPVIVFKYSGGYWLVWDPATISTDDAIDFAYDRGNEPDPDFMAGMLGKHRVCRLRKVTRTQDEG